MLLILRESHGIGESPDFQREWFAALFLIATEDGARVAYSARKLFTIRA